MKTKPGEDLTLEVGDLVRVEFDGGMDGTCEGVILEPYRPGGTSIHIQTTTPRVSQLERQTYPIGDVLIAHRVEVIEKLTPQPSDPS